MNNLEIGGTTITDSSGTPLTCEEILACIFDIMVSCAPEGHAPIFTPDLMWEFIQCAKCELNCAEPSDFCELDGDEICETDWNGDGSVDDGDIEFYLWKFFECCPGQPLPGEDPDPQGPCDNENPPRCLAGPSPQSNPAPSSAREIIPGEVNQDLGYSCWTEIADGVATQRCAPLKQLYGDRPCPPKAPLDKDSREESTSDQTEGSDSKSEKTNCEGEGGTPPTAPDPVLLASGDKVESATDLVVKLPGRDFEMRRSYSSRSGLGGADMIGVNWTSNVFSFISVSSLPGSLYSVRLDGGGFAGHLKYESASSTGPWSANGSTSQYFTRVANAITLPNTVQADVWRLVEPGVRTMDFYDPLDARSNGVNTFYNFGGLLAREQDIYGNTWTYEYIHDSADQTRLNAIYLNGTSSANAVAVVRFGWHLDDNKPAELRGKLMVAALERRDANGDLVPIETVWYFYKTDDDAYGTSSDLGTAGDLIMVINRSMVDLAPSDSSNARELITQYRYHRTAASPTGTERELVDGADHQLKMVLRSEQIEYAAQKLQFEAMTPKTTGTALKEWAVELLGKLDGDTVFTENSNAVELRDLAAKIVGYSSGKVSRQYLQAGCGCSGNAQGLRLDYAYSNNWTRTQESVSVTGKSTRIEESALSGGSYALHRTLYYDMVLKGAAQVPYLDTKAVVEPGTGGRAWVQRSVYDTTNGRNLVREITPSAVSAYAPCDFAGSPTAPSVAPRASDGLVWEYAYTADNRRSSVGVRRGVSGTQSLLSVTEYDSTRPWLPVQVDRYRDEGVTTAPGSTSADTLETVAYTYGFHSGTDAIQWITRSEEAELVSENGPGGTYETHEVYNTLGQNIWSCTSDNVLTAREFDANTGSVTRIVRNAAATGLPSLGGSGAPSTTSWGVGTTGGTLETSYKHDLFGRVIEMVSPGGVHAYFVRRLRAVADRPGLYYYAETTLPHEVSSSGGVHVFDGPASITWYSAGGRTIATSDYELSKSAVYAPDKLQFTILSMPDKYGSLGLTVNRHSLSGLLMERTVYADCEMPILPGSVSPDVPNVYTTTFEYDGLGRLTLVTDPQGGKTEQSSYDVLGRVLEVKVGAGASAMTTVAEYFYDGDPSAMSPAQGVGNGMLTTTVLHLASSTRRSDRHFDYRDRLITVDAPEGPFEAVQYDNLGRAVKRALFETFQQPSAGSGLTLAPGSGVGQYSESEFSQRGSAVRTRIALAPSSAGTSYLESNRWYDSEGRTIATWGPNSPMVKWTYDSLGRSAVSYVTDRRNDPLPGQSGSWAAAASVSDDTVAEQVTYTYADAFADPGDNIPDRVAIVETRQRNHDGSGYGALTSSNSVASYAGFLYDSANRQVRTINFGTNSGTDVFVEGSAPTWPPASVPDWSSMDPTQIVTGVTYNARGLVEDQIDPLGRKTRTLYDDLNRRVAVIENYHDAVVAWSAYSGMWEVTGGASYDGVSEVSDEDRVTSFVYDGNSQLRFQVAHAYQLASPAHDNSQVTEYVYGVSTSDSPLASEIASSRLLRAVHYPDAAGGGSDISARGTVFYAYNRLGELTATKDQNGTVHEYARDGIGRVIRDDVTAFGYGTSAGHAFVIDDRVKSLRVSYDAMGRLETAKSYDTAVTGGAVLNAVGFEYTPLWQIKDVRQDIDSDIFAAVTGAASRPTRTVSYTYEFADISSGNYARLDHMSYPDDGTAAGYDYSGSSLDEIMARVSTLSYSGTTFFANAVAYSYVGTSTVVGVDYPDADVQLDRTLGDDGARRLSGYTTQAAGTYPGFDRFGRVRRHTWVTGGYTQTGSPAGPDRPALAEERYTYDNASNRLSKSLEQPFVNHGWLYGYDGLDRLNLASRGGITVSSGVASLGTRINGSQSWNLDVLGNWQQFHQENVPDTTTPSVTYDGDADQTGDMQDQRSHNSKNEIETTLDAGDATGPQLPFAYDFAGNLAANEEAGGKTQLVYVHDAWNRLVRVVRLVQSTDTPACDPETLYSETSPLNATAPGYVIADYRYNALHWRVRKVSDTSETLDCPADDSATNTTPLTSELDQRRDMYYDASWRLVHEEIDDDFHPTSLATAEGTGGGTEGDTFNLTRVGQILWGVRYIDDAVMRQVSTAFTDTPPEGGSPAVLSVDWNDGIDEEEGRTAKRWWYLTDVQFSVVGLIDPTWGSMVTERVEYSPYGVPLYQPATDFDGDGDVDVGDESAFLDSWYAQFGGSGIGPGPASADRDRSGVVGVADLFDFLDAWFADMPVGGPGAPEGWISRKEVPPSMGVQDGPLGPDNPVGYCGYINNPETGDYTVRFRHYSPTLGRWLERDPAGYVDGGNLYQYAVSKPATSVDPLGLDVGWARRPGNDPYGEYLGCGCYVVLNWKGTWTFAEKARLRLAIERSKHRAKQLIEQIDAIKASLSPCVAKELDPDLKELRKRMADLIALLNNSEKTIKIYQRDLGSEIEAQTKGYRGLYNAYCEINNSSDPQSPNWHLITLDNLSALLLHELSHIVEGSTDYDGTGKLYDLHNINTPRGFFFRNIVESEIYKVLLARAKKKCGEDDCEKQDKNE